MFFVLDEDNETINRIPFYRQVVKPFNRKEKYYDIVENESINEISYNPLFDDIGKENYEKLKEYQTNNEIEKNKNKFLNLFSSDWAEVRKEYAKFVLIVYKECPNIFEIKKIYIPEEESIDKKIYYLKYLKKYKIYK